MKNILALLLLSLLTSCVNSFERPQDAEHAELDKKYKLAQKIEAEYIDRIFDLSYSPDFFKVTKLADQAKKESKKYYKLYKEANDKAYDLYIQNQNAPKELENQAAKYYYQYELYQAKEKSLRAEALYIQNTYVIPAANQKEIERLEKERDDRIAEIYKK